MDAAQPDSSSGGAAYEPLAGPRPSRFQWIWAPLALGVAAMLVAATIMQLMRVLGVSLILSNPYIYTHQAELNAALTAVDELAVPVVVVVAACVVALRLPDVTRRGAAVARLLIALVLLIGIAWLRQVANTSVYRVLTNGQSTAAAGSAAYHVLAMIMSAISGLPLGVTIAIALRLLPSRLTPRGIAPRLGYWMLAGGLAGIAAAFFSQRDRFLLLTVQAIRLASVDVTDCMVGSGSFCYSGQLLDLAYYSVLPLIVGAVLGAAIGGALAPDLTAGRLGGSASSSAPATPKDSAGAQTQGQRGSRAGGALRYVAGAAVGIFYLTLVLTLAFLLEAFISRTRLAPTNSPSAATGLIIYDTLSLLIPAAWLALAGARDRLASAPGRRGKRALRWTLALLAVMLAVAAPVVAIPVQGVSYLDGSPMIALAAFSLGAAYGLLWAPRARSARPQAAWRVGVRAAATGWIGVSLPVLILLGVEFYTLVTYRLSPNDCHGLACGALLFVLFNAVITISVNIIIVGLPVALFAGGLSGMIREALRTP